MPDDIIKIQNQLRERLLSRDRRFGVKNGQLMFAGISLPDLAKQYPTPFYIFSQQEILQNIKEIQQAFLQHRQTKIFFASKACSVMNVLRVIKESGINAEANSLFEIRKCLEIGFTGQQIIFNGVVKQPEDLEYAIANDLYLINVDSIYELDLIDTISRKLRKVANVCVRIEPNVPSVTRPELMTGFHAKAGIDLLQAEEACRRILSMPYVKLRGLHMHLGDQVAEVSAFAKGTQVLVNEAARLEELFNIQFDLINVGGGIPVPYKYDQENGDPLQDHLYEGFTAQNFAAVIIHEVHKWRKDIEICVEPGRKVVGSAAVLITKVCSEKRKTCYNIDGSFECYVDWKFIDAGYSVLADSQHYDWFFYLYNASRISEQQEQYVKLAGPLCDGGDYFHIGVKGEEFLLPRTTQVGDMLVFLDTGAYTIENQTVYNNRPRTAVVMVDSNNQPYLIRRQDTYEDIVKYDIY